MIAFALMEPTVPPDTEKEPWFKLLLRMEKELKETVQNI